MKTLNAADDEEIELLRRVNCPSNVIDHCISVKHKAMQLVSSLAVDVDGELVRHGALLHDIGRSVTHSLNHAVEGMKLANELNLDEATVRIIARHIGSGITNYEAKTLGLPPGQYIPETREEKIVSYADSLTSNVKHISFEEAYDKLSRQLGKDNPALARFRALHEEVQSWMRR